jgi:selenocysteine lyase/cysteine desulfurase
MLLEQIRKDTPACASLIHLNNAGASLNPLPVQQAMSAYAVFEAATGGYEAADARAAEIDGFYTSVARMLNTQARNIAFASSATDAYTRALSVFDWQPGEVLLTTNHDYISSQLSFLSLQQRYGIQLIRARDTAEGGVDVADMEALIRQYRPKLVAVTHIPTNSGLIQPVYEIGAICRELDTWYLVDACQSAGQMPLDVQAMGCDFLSATMRKFMRGPRGAGFLYASDRALEAPLTMLLPDMKGAHWTSADTFVPVETARRYEQWERNPALMIGSKVAIDYAMRVGLDWIADRTQYLAQTLRGQLAEIPGLRVLDQGEYLSGIVTCYHPKFDGTPLRNWLRERRINTSISTLDVAQIDFGQKQVPFALRFSPHYYNTEAELVQAVAATGEWLA